MPTRVNSTEGSHDSVRSLPTSDLQQDPLLLVRQKPMRLLSPREEVELVTELCQLRSEIDQKIRPWVEKNLGEDDQPLNHFDQLMSAYRQHEKVPVALERWLKSRYRRYAAIKHKLVIGNLAWLMKLTRNSRTIGVSEEDLFQEGMCGMLKAIDRFEAARGLRLMTYATWYIREAMQQIRARQGHLLSLSAHDQTLLNRLDKVKSDFQQQHQRPPSEAELAKLVDRPQLALRKLRSASSSAVRLDRTQETGAVGVPVEDPAIEFDRLDSIKGTVRKLLSGLSQRERIVVTRRFGLDGGTPTSLEALGSALQISKERVRQLQRQAIKRMQQMSKQQAKRIMPA